MTTAQGISAGVDTLLMSDEQQFSDPASERPFGMPAQRTPVVFDSQIGGMRIGEHVRRVEDPAEPTQLYGAYLSLLYAVRGAKPGEQLSLRAADLEALLLIVGDDPETIEKRLIGLMGCSADEAKLLGGILLRHRKKATALGVAASLLLGGSLASGMGSPERTPPKTELVQSVSAEASRASEAPTPGGSAPSAIPNPGETGVVAPAPGRGPTATPAVPATGGSRSSGGGKFATPAAPTGPVAVADRPVATEPPPVAAPPEALPAAPVEVEPRDRDLPPVPGRPIGGTVGGEDGDGSSFEEPAPSDAAARPVRTPLPDDGGAAGGPEGQAGGGSSSEGGTGNAGGTGDGVGNDGIGVGNGGESGPDDEENGRKQ